MKCDFCGSDDMFMAYAIVCQECWGILPETERRELLIDLSIHNRNLMMWKGEGGCDD
jgi:hypothetical protein